jgi:hypothetical protein
MLEKFHQAPLLHEIRSITLQTVRNNRPGAGETPTPGPGGFPQLQQRGGGRGGQGGETSNLLDVNMKVEALMLTGAEVRPDMKPSIGDGKLQVLAEPSRHYPNMLAKNIFTGPRLDNNEGTGPVEPIEEALGHVKLTMLYHDGRRWQATFYNQSKGPPEYRVNTFTLDEFRVFDAYENIAFESKVKLVDEKQVILEAKGKYYRLYIGDLLYAALSQPLSDGDLDKLGIKKKTVAAAEESSKTEPVNSAPSKKD